MAKQNTRDAFERFFATIQRLRGEGGCPWDIDQTPLAMRGDLIEEVFEAVDAISDGDAAHAKEELGDVLLNTLLISYMYEQAGNFTVAEVFDAVTGKLIRRHPHVFAESEGRAFLQSASLNPDEVIAQWEAIKAGVEHRHSDSILDEVPRGFPPLLKAYKLQKKAAKKGFDWKAATDVYSKVQEEISEVIEASEKLVSATGELVSLPAKPFTTGAIACQNEAQLHLEEEIGDAFFALVNWSRHLHCDPSAALSRANEKFSRRFRAVEKRAEADGKEMKSLTLEELDRLWEQAKVMPETDYGAKSFLHSK
jgi:tetrapyrrole methylase family protein/MazG family protein